VSRINNDQMSATVWLALGLIITIASVPYGLGTLDSPGTGFLPFLSGLAITLFSFIGLVHATLKRRMGVGWKPVMRGLIWKKSLIVLLALLAYVWLLKPLGFSLCTALFIGFLLRAVQPQRWPVVMVGAIGAAVGAYGIFEVWLKAQLPRGPWGF
jgi:putative tricarboxylic transport membrane protein